MFFQTRGHGEGDGNVTETRNAVVFIGSLKWAKKNAIGKMFERQEKRQLILALGPGSALPR